MTETISFILVIFGLWNYLAKRHYRADAKRLLSDLNFARHQNQLLREHNDFLFKRWLKSNQIEEVLDAEIIE